MKEEMLQKIIQFDHLPDFLDATDATAAAVCHYFQRSHNIIGGDDEKKTVKIVEKEALADIVYEVTKNTKKEMPAVKIGEQQYIIYHTELIIDEEVGKLVVLVDITKEKELFMGMTIHHILII